MNPEGESENYLYFDISKQERDSAIRYLLGSIIQTRDRGSFPSNVYGFDEDVNIYLAHLLFAVSLPEYHEMAEPYLSRETSDILRWVRSTEDRTIRYFIFKVNADHLLIHTAVFGDLSSAHEGKFYKKSEKHYRELAKLYYEQAATYHRRIYRKKTGVGDVLDKISKYFDEYQEMLKDVRRDYLQFLNGFRDQAFTFFMKDLNRYERQSEKDEKMDHFLEMYQKWRSNPTDLFRIELEKLAREIKDIDPEFQFNLDEPDEKGGYGDERKYA